MLALVLMAVIVPPFINVSRFRVRIAGAIQNAVGRPATIDRVTLRLFPEPGLNLQNLVIADDPALSAEPLLRADEVTATLRLSSLWRGRLEIGKLSLKYPSLNLVRGPDGRWNIESLLEQVRKIPAAPTAKTRPESRPRFPYIEADGGRINFKVGLEKKVYALTEADFALWLASENRWRVRLAARPVRTDANLSDTGTVKLTGSFERGPNLRQTPLQLKVEIESAQLGQLTSLVFGRDRGWRGSLNAAATLTGTPAALSVTADASVDDFRRYDIMSDERLRLEAHCNAAYSTATEVLSPLACRFPVGGGSVAARGSITGPMQPVSYDLSVTAEELPAQALVVLARHVKKDLPADLAATGDVDAAFTLRKAAGAPHAWAGAGTVSSLRLRSSTLGPPLIVGEISFLLDGPGTDQFVAPGANKHAPRPQPFPETVINVRSFSVPLGGPAPAKARAWFSQSGYSLNVQGDAQVQRVLQVARGLGLRATAAAATGNARMDLQIAGNWFGFAAPTAVGTAQLRGVSVPLRGVASPLQISSAELVLTPQDATLQRLAAGFSGTRMDLSGWVRLPRGCETLPQCPAQFELQADQLATEDLNRLLNPRLRQRSWYKLFGGGDTESLFTKIRATGHISAARVLARSVAARHVTADLKLDVGRIAVSNFRGDLFGGTLRGDWQADFTGDTPTYAARGRLERASMAQVATAMNDDWATGAADLQYQGTASGWTGNDLAASAAGSVQFEWRDGALAHVGLAGAQPPLRFRKFSGQMTLHEGILKLGASKMETPTGIYQVSGTASLARQLALRLSGEGSQGFVINGTLEKPKVVRANASDTRASLQ
jgi:hypothetical protein